MMAAPGDSVGPEVLGLRSTKSNSVSSYGTTSTRRAHLANLYVAAIGGDFKRRRFLRCDLGQHRGAPPVNLWLQERDEKLPVVPLLLLGRFNCSKRWWKLQFGGHVGFGVLFELWLEI
jgi:hypothetical protein